MEKVSSGHVIIQEIDNIDCKIFAEPSILMELCDRFTFYAKGYKFNPKFKAGFWDGKIYLFSVKSQIIKKGLIDNIKDFCKENNYQITLNGNFDDADFSTQEAKDFIASLNIPERFEIRDYQIESFVYCVRKKRSLFISPTSSGKSLILYWLYRYYNTKSLLIVPKIGLITQMIEDFKDYGYTEPIHSIFAGETHDTNNKLTISTWQSLTKKSSSWLNQFKLLVVDESHNATAACLTSIVGKCNAEYRFGLTGSTDDLQVSLLTLEGLFGTYKKIISTRELIDKGYAANLEIKAIVLKYPAEIRELNKRKIIPYEDEISYLISSKRRNNFIKNLALSLKGNVIILFRRIDDHGAVLKELFEKNTDRPIYYATGDNNKDEKELIRQTVNKETNCIFLASMGTFSEGISIVNLHHGILAHPSKAKIGLIQRIGRGLRKSKEKTDFKLYDIADDMSYKNKRNYTLLHFAERIKLYNQEEFAYNIYNIEIKPKEKPNG